MSYTTPLGRLPLAALTSALRHHPSIPPAVRRSSLIGMMPVTGAIRRPSIAGTAIRRPSIEGTAIRRPSIEGTAIRRPSIEGTAIRRPSIAGTAVRRRRFSDDFYGDDFLAAAASLFGRHDSAVEAMTAAERMSDADTAEPVAARTTAERMRASGPTMTEAHMMRAASGLGNYYW
jgi:hypothetical protein